MKSFRLPELLSGFRFAVFVYALVLCLLGTGMTYASDCAPESNPPGRDVASHNRNDINGSEASGIVFEEPRVNGAASSIALPEPEDGLALPVQEELPRVAIIIDDMGYHQKLGEELLGLDLNLTFSFLPHAPFTEEQEEHAWRMGRDVLVHMPMEARDSAFDPGPGTLYLEDSAEKIILTVENNLEFVPHAIGVNNHMGSKFTADRQAMQEVLAILKSRGLFFVDSVTTPESVGAKEATRMGIKAGRRIVFLDNSQTQENICRQLRLLVAYAKKHGSGIGIGHPNRATVNALKQCRELLLQQVKIVGIHELVR